MPPLADYGGGSGCGGMYVYERRWPEAFRNAAYTCDWGTSEVYLHRLETDGPTFKPHQETFLKIARPTDIDVDTSGRMLVSSWLNGGFSFSGDNVGFIAQVTPKDFLPKPFPYLAELPAEKLVDLLKTSGAAGQFHISRELLRRDEQDEIGSMLLDLSADSNASVETRVAAIFTLKQLLGRKANVPLQNLGKKDPSIRRWTLRALTDRIDEIESDTVAWIGECLQDSDVTVQAQALVSLRQVASSEVLSRETKASIAKLVLAMPVLSESWQPQPHQLPQVERVLPHLAMLTLTKLDAAEPIVEALGGSQRQLALLTLRQMHSEAAVSEIIRRLYRPVDNELRIELLSLLSRLYFEEGAYERGDWWGTRPDTTGPYYDRQTWAMTDRIDRVLKATFEQGDSDLRQKMQKDFDRFKLPLSKDATGSSIAAEEMKQQPIVIEHVDPTNPQLIGNQKLEAIQQNVVSLKGNAEAGKKLFETQACIACHTFADGQLPKGPHLVDIGRRYTRPELVESLIQPSAKIAQGFDSWQFLTKDGEVLTGFVVTESADRVLLRNGQGVLQALSQDDIEERKKQEQSMMPQGLVGALTVEQLSDLLAYLETLK